MTWSFPGISYPVESEYTQTRGVHPDAVLMRFLPQAGNIPTSGTWTMTWNGATITLPNCVVDKDTLGITPDGIHHTVIAWDRRERWKYAAPVSGYYNVTQAGSYVTAFKKSLRQLCTLLLTALGEGSIDVSAVANDVYPQVRWLCEEPRLLLEKLMNSYGLDLCLGFGSEVVTIVPVGSGASLPSGDEFITSLTADPKLRPYYIRTCFGESKMQARFLLEAIGLDSDGETWELIDDLAYKPAAGWGAEDPYTLPTVQKVSGDDIWRIGLATVYRVYRIKAFADDSLTIPDGSGTLSSITDILPLNNKLLSSENPLQEAFRPFRLFGAHYRVVREKGQPATQEITDVDFELTHYRCQFDPETGVVVFEEPVFSVDAGAFVPAELYLECAFGKKDTTTNAPTVYHKDTTFDTSGYGYYTVQVPDQFAQVTVQYDSTHTVTGSTNNQSTLDSIAALEAAALVSSMSSSFSTVKVYSHPVLSIRLDGAITQVKHVSTNGEGRNAVNRTTAARFGEFDRNVPSRKQRMNYLQGLLTAAQSKWNTLQLRRRGPSDG